MVTVCCNGKKGAVTRSVAHAIEFMKIRKIKTSRASRLSRTFLFVPHRSSLSEQLSLVIAAKPIDTESSDVASSVISFFFKFISASLSFFNFVVKRHTDAEP